VGVSRDDDRDHLLAQVLVKFAYTLGTDFSIQKILDHLVQAIVDILPVTGAGVMLMGDRQELHFIAASDTTVMTIERLQNELAEGPCLEAYQFGLPVTIDDLSVDTRFPRFSPRGLTEGMAAVFTFPLTLDDERLGALDLYRDTPGALSDEDLQAAQVLADVASAYLFNAQARIDASATVARLNHRSLHDSLTGLANRTLFEELLEQAIARARRSQNVAAVLFVDLDGFKAVNDQHGHLVGDRLLSAVARRLTRVLRPADTAARMGGDEFVVLCEDLADRGDAESVARRIAAAIADPFDLDGHRISVTASVGIAFSGPGQDVPEALLRDADFAMYQAKSGGGDRMEVLDPAARLAADRREQLELDLQHAQSRNELSLAYQPILDVHSRQMVGAEALLRWTHPERGTVEPAVVIPSAERTGLILALGEWVLRQACADLRHWQDSGIGVPAIAVNVSAHQLMGPAFAQTVERVLEATGADPQGVSLEVTETVFLADVSRAVTVMQDVKDLGVGLSLDDFGTGYSSLNYLRRFPFDRVKIDRSFTADAETDEVTRRLIGAMIDFSHGMDLTVIAEGIETSQELTQMTGLGADEAQGYHLSRPLTRDRLEEYAQHRAHSAAG
jgi:diguanylate cyclase (GGDEF)-like protein